MSVSPRLLVTTVALTLVALGGSSAGAQTPAADPSARLRAVLPAEVAARVLARVREARAQGLPGDALANRALKFAAKGVPPAAIARAVDEQAVRMAQVKTLLQSARGRPAAPDEIEAGAEAMRTGLTAAQVRTLARDAPSGRSLAVPLYVVQGLVARGLPADSALRRVVERLTARASDADLERLPAQLPVTPPGGAGEVPNPPGRALGLVRQGAGSPGHGATGGPPVGIPRNGGAKAKPAKPATPRGPGRGPGGPPGKGHP